MKETWRVAIYIPETHPPSNLYLEEACAAMEGTEAANVFSSGMGAITSTILQICKSGDHIISSRTVYGGTYAFLKTFTPQIGIETDFVDITKINAIKNLVKKNTKIIYCEVSSNPLLEVADIESLSKISKENGLKLIVDNHIYSSIHFPQNLELML